MRGRNPDNPSDRRKGCPTEQRIEIGGVVLNCLTTVSKDTLVFCKVVYEKGGENESMIVKEPTETESGAVNIVKDVEPEVAKTVEDYLYTANDGEQYGIFKLSPRECGRLMGVMDKDIDKMLAVNSNSQCYKQYGNSIVVPVLCGIFSQLNIKGVPMWNRMSDEEREVWINPDNLHAEE